ncbi:MAG: histidine--tRNA ligase [Phycisphaerae bacterium]|nr:histidine--tRNA ligase [Phycisphaerae bacterium]
MSDTPRRINALKGFDDVLPAQSRRWQIVEAHAREAARIFHYDEIRTPTLEEAGLFHRGVGETSDIVRKETYTFTDRDGSLVTLRPEGTAGVVRAVIESGLLNDQGARVKVYYISSNFRHERPQRGRVRQHHQFGAEAFGVAEPEQDVECIQLQLDFYRRCGLKDLALRLNSLGDSESKQRYRDVLVRFLEPKRAELSEDSQRRLDTNPLRILDSKDPRDVAAVAGAPPARESLSEKSRQHFERVNELLKKGAVPFILDGSLVRGFDYYTDTLWEVTAGGLGAQNAVGGGGRYDNLVEQLGGRPTPAVGFGSGIERLLLALGDQPLPPEPLVWLIANGDAARDANLKLLADLRGAGISVDMDLGRRSMKSQFKLADREKATMCVIVGEDELAKNVVTIKNFATGDQKTIPMAELVDELRLFV